MKEKNKERKSKLHSPEQLLIDLFGSDFALNRRQELIEILGSTMEESISILEKTEGKDPRYFNAVYQRYFQGKTQEQTAVLLKTTQKWTGALQRRGMVLFFKTLIGDYSYKGPDMSPADPAFETLRSFIVDLAPESDAAKAIGLYRERRGRRV